MGDSGDGPETKRQRRRRGFADAEPTPSAPSSIQEAALAQARQLVAMQQRQAQVVWPMHHPFIRHSIMM